MEQKIDVSKILFFTQQSADTIPWETFKIVTQYQSGVKFIDTMQFYEPTESFCFENYMSFCIVSHKGLNDMVLGRSVFDDGKHTHINCYRKDYVELFKQQSIKETELVKQIENGN